MHRTLAWLAAGLAMTCAAPPADAAVRRVWPNGFGSYPNIQAAWNQAQSGDEIELQPGVFAGAGNTNLALSGKSILLRSASGDPHSTLLDCAGQRVAFSGGSVVTFRGIGFARANGYEGKDSALQFQSCRFDGANQVALAIGGTSYAFDHCSFDGGTGLLFADIEGSLSFTDCTFLDNAAGVASSWAMTFERCLFRGNGAGDGTAVVDCYYLFYPQQTSFRACRFEENLAPPIAAYDDYLDVDHCVFARNPAPAVSWTIAFDSSISLHIGGSTFVDQEGGPAIRVRRAWDVLTLSATIENSIVAFTSGGPAIECVDLAPENLPMLRCSDLYGNSGGDYVGCVAGFAGQEGNQESDPLFCARGDGAYTLQDGSPCLDAPGCGQVGALGVGCATASAPNARMAEALLISPNPTRGLATIALARQDARIDRIDVVDAAGRAVRRLEPASSTDAITWDGRNNAGVPTPAGLYYLRVVTNQGTRIGSLLRLP